MNLAILGIIFLISLILGLIKFGTLQTAGWNGQRKFAETWNDSVNFIIAGLIGYYFILVRWPLLQDGETFSTGDFVLLAIFAMGLFGHLCVMSKNITEGINAILKTILGENNLL